MTSHSTLAHAINNKSETASDLQADRHLPSESTGRSNYVKSVDPAPPPATRPVRSPSLSPSCQLSVLLSLDVVLLSCDSTAHHGQLADVSPRAACSGMREDDADVMTPPLPVSIDPLTLANPCAASSSYPLQCPVRELRRGLQAASGELEGKARWRCQAAQGRSVEMMLLVMVELKLG